MRPKKEMMSHVELDCLGEFKGKSELNIPSINLASLLLSSFLSALTRPLTEYMSISSSRSGSKPLRADAKPFAPSSSSKSSKDVSGGSGNTFDRPSPAKGTFSQSHVQSWTLCSFADRSFTLNLGP